MLWSIQFHANGTKRQIITSMNHADLVVSYKLVLQCMQKISNYHKNKLHAMGRHHKPFIGVYDNFEQLLRVQDQQSDHNKKFYSVTTCQFIVLMWMPTGCLLQSMLN